jgi:hypothetical protein
MVPRLTTCSTCVSFFCDLLLLLSFMNLRLCPVCPIQDNPCTLDIDKQLIPSLACYPASSSDLICKQTMCSLNPIQLATPIASTLMHRIEVQQQYLGTFALFFSSQNMFVCVCNNLLYLFIFILFNLNMQVVPTAYLTKQSAHCRIYRTQHTTMPSARET